MQEENNQTQNTPKEFEQPIEDYWNPAERFGIDANGNENIKSHDFVGCGMTATIRGSAITDRRDYDYLLSIYARGNMNNVLEAALSFPERGMVEQSHQHFVITLKENKNMRIPEAIKLPSGKMVMIYNRPLTQYSQETKDIAKLIDYMEKNGEKCLYKFKAPDFDKYIGKSKRIVWSKHVENALAMPTLKQAADYLKGVDIKKWMDDKKKFMSEYVQQHEREMQLRATYKPDLLPFKDLPETKQIMDWVKRASVNNRKRNGILFVVGPTKTGKTEFVIQNVYRKYDSFLMRGNYLWDKYDSEHEGFKFLIFDDVHPEMQMVKDIKALTSTKNVKTQMNIKYSYAMVTSLPCIILMNENNYDQYWRLIGYAKETEWYKRNSLIIKIDDFLYPLKSELRKAEIEKRKELRNNNQEDMSEHSIENFDDDKTEEVQQENEEQEEHENENSFEKQEKKPKEKIPYERKTKHSFRSRVKHLLKRMNKDDDQIEQFMDEMDEIGLNDIEDKEAIEYGFNTDDDIEDHPSLEEEIEGEKARKQMFEMKNNQHPADEYVDEEVEEDDSYNGLPPSTRNFTGGHYVDEDGIIHD